LGKNVRKPQGGGIFSTHTVQLVVKITNLAQPRWINDGYMIQNVSQTNGTSTTSLGTGGRLGRQGSLAKDQIGSLFSHHHNWTVDVSTDNTRHDRRIDDPQTVDPYHPAHGIDHHHLVGLGRAHSAGARGVIGGFDGGADECVDVGVRLNVFSRQNLLTAKLVKRSLSKHLCKRRGNHQLSHVYHYIAQTVRYDTIRQESLTWTGKLSIQLYLAHVARKRN